MFLATYMYSATLQAKSSVKNASNSLAMEICTISVLKMMGSTGNHYILPQIDTLHRQQKEGYVLLFYGML